MELLIWISALLIAAGTGWLVYKADKKKAVPYPILTASLRAIVVFLTLMLVLLPSVLTTSNTVEKPIIVFLQDNSQSISKNLDKDTESYKSSSSQLIQKLEKEFTVATWGFSNKVNQENPFLLNGNTTNISNAIDKIREVYGMQNLGAIILASDGKYNEGTNPVYDNTGLKAAMYTIGIGDTALQKDINIARTYANRTATLNSSFEIRADILASLCKNFNQQLVVKENNNIIATSSLIVNNDRFDRSVSFLVKASQPGLHHYTIEVPIADGEVNTNNNSKDVFVEVLDDKKKILLASAAPHPDITAIKEALAGVESYNVSVYNVDQLPTDLSSYDAFILHGLPSNNSEIAKTLSTYKKPTWFILSGATNFPALNSLSGLTGLQFNPTSTHDAYAVLNPSFNLFNLPLQSKQTTEKLPPLSTNVANIALPAGYNTLYYQKDTKEPSMPLWLLIQGNTPYAVLGGEGVWRWRLHEYKNYNTHTVIDECIRQTVAFLVANSSNKPFVIGLPKYIWSDREAISMKGFLYNTNRQEINEPEVTLSVFDSNNSKKQYTFEKSGTNYSINIGLWGGGLYKYIASTTYNNKPYTSSGSFMVENTPIELMDQGADFNLLYSLSKAHNGAFTTSKNISIIYDSIKANKSIKPIINTASESVPFVDKKWFFIVILLLVTGEWLIRKYWMAV